MKSNRALAALAPLAIVFVIGRKPRSGGVDKLPPTKLPPTVDPMREVRLFVPMPEDHPDEQAFAQWLELPPLGAPELIDDDLKPRVASRRLTPFERWALSPYFIAEDLDAMIHNGKQPPEVVGQRLPDELWALTTIDGEVWFPNRPRSFLSLWWLSTLAHELYHRGQVRIGATPAQAQESFRRWGYVDSPQEVQARWQQRRVLDGLAARARGELGSV